MKDPYGEKLATHTGPESCVYIRKGIDEALTGGVRAGLLSRERSCKLQFADAVHKVEGNPAFSGTREPGGPTFGLIVRSAL